jgi:hypothetical protein
VTGNESGEGGMEVRKRLSAYEAPPASERRDRAPRLGGHRRWSARAGDQVHRYLDLDDRWDAVACAVH